ncbi:hypothetical protein [Peribacillus muralis]
MKPVNNLYSKISITPKEWLLPAAILLVHERISSVPEMYIQLISITVKNH